MLGAHSVLLIEPVVYSIEAKDQIAGCCPGVLVGILLFQRLGNQQGSGAVKWAATGFNPPQRRCKYGLVLILMGFLNSLP
jgi:hypothetical protein